MDMNSWIATAAGTVAAISGGVAMVKRNAINAEKAAQAAVREIKDLAVLTRVDISGLNKAVRALEAQIKQLSPSNSTPSPRPQPAKKQATKKTAPKKTAPKSTGRGNK